MKDRILEVIFELIQEKGIKKLTLDDISRKLKISKKTLYKYFKSKDDMLIEYIDSYIQFEKEGTLRIYENKDGIIEKIFEIINARYKFFIPMRIIEELKVLYPKEWLKIEELKEFKLELITNLISKGISQGIFKEQINYIVLKKLLVNISNESDDPDYLIENDLTFKTFIKESLNIIFEGIKK
ncbi:TetR/AcrR family transcriptional regulator [Streptococcus hongkongensis]|nr:hypothetical protein NC01_07785 [Streptococcus uberis]